MTVEEMADWFCKDVYAYEFCPYCYDLKCVDSKGNKFKQWLESESEEQ